MEPDFYLRVSRRLNPMRSSNDARATEESLIAVTQG